MTDTCAHCRFWLMHPKNSNGDCRRHPPVPIMVGMAAPQFAGQNPTPVVMPYFVTMQPTDWCGDFENRPPTPKALDLSKIKFTGEA